MNSYLAISRDALNKNARALIDYVKTPIIAVVKCDGYGIGIKNAADAWYAAGVRRFAVAEPSEALTLCELGYPDAQILLMSPCYEKDTLTALGQSGCVTFTVTTAQCAERLVEVCGEYLPRANVKINTGMGRFGLRYDEIDKIAALYNTKGIEFTGIFSHFALSFERGYDKTRLQLERFLQVTDALSARGIAVGERHIANSCAALRFPQTRLDAVRIGSALIGRLVTAGPLVLNRVGVLRAQAVDCTLLRRGDCSGYAMLYRARRDTPAAVIAAGYRNGLGLVRDYDRFRLTDLARNLYHELRGYRHFRSVMAGDTRHAVLGRIGNQFTLVDNSDGGIRPGDYVEIPVNTLMVDSAVPRVLQ